MRFTQLILFFSFPLFAQANYVDLEVGNGSSYKTQSLSAGGDLEKAKHDQNTFNWNLSYTHTASETASTSGGSIKDNTHDFSGGFGIETKNKMTASLDLSYSTSPEENLTSAGPQIFAGMTFDYGQKISKDESDEEDNAFVPSFGFEIGVAQSTYRQDYSTTVTRSNGKTRPVSGQATLVQKSASLILKWSPLDWMSVKATGTAYTYDKDVAQFSQYLDSSPTLSSSGLGGLLSGFPSSSGKLSLSFYPWDSWDLGLSSSRSISAVSQTLSNTSKISVGYHFLNSWKVGLSSEATKTEATSTSAESTDNLVAVSLSKDL